MDPVAELMMAASDGAALTLLLRYEGVLVENVPAAPLVPDASLAALLRRVAKRPQTRVHVLTASTPAVCRGWFDGSGVTLHTEDAAPAGMTTLLARIFAETPDSRLVVIGASLVDEVIFPLVRAPHVTARVGSGATMAEARLEDTVTVRGLLGALC